MKLIASSGTRWWRADSVCHAYQYFRSCSQFSSFQLIGIGSSHQKPMVVSEGGQPVFRERLQVISNRVPDVHHRESHKGKM